MSLPQAGYEYYSLCNAASMGNLAFFGLGFNGTSPSNVVDIYDTASGTWTTASLSQARYGLAESSAGNEVVFAGGNTGSGPSNVVDIYNAASNTWSTATLSQARYGLSAASVGNLILFAGGDSSSGPSNVVDIYDTSTGSWSTAALSEARDAPSATSAGNQVFFAGGAYSNGNTSSVVDIYTLQNYPSVTSSKAFTLVDQTTVAGTMQLNSPGSLALGAFTLNVGSMSGNAPIDLGSGTLTVGSDNTATTYTGAITGNGSLIKTGSQTLTINAAVANDSRSSLIQVAGGNLSLGDATVFNGFGTSGQIAVGGNCLTLNSLGFANLGVLTTISGGTLTAPNGISLGVGCNLSGSGVVNGKIAAGYGSTIYATGNLTLGRFDFSRGLHQQRRTLHECQYRDDQLQQRRQ